MSLSTMKKVLESGIKNAEKELARFTKSEARSRAAWTKSYRIFKKAAVDIANLAKHGTKKEQALREIINSWDKKNIELTKGRDDFRQQIKDKEAELNARKIELAKVMAQIENEINANDGLVEQVFKLNSAIVDAFDHRNDYLSDNVYSRLIDDEGNLRRQLTIDNSAGIKRVVALVNSIQLVDSARAAEAKKLIQAFFDNLQSKLDMDEATAALHKLTKELLVEKTSFKIGPTFYQFIGMRIDAKIFPDLVRAQDLLKSSLRSEKTNSYIRLYVRPDRHSPWKPVVQK